MRPFSSSDWGIFPVEGSVSIQISPVGGRFGSLGGLWKSGFFQRLEECSVGIFVGASVGWDEIGRGGVTGKADLLYDAAVGGPAGEFGAV